MCAPEDVFAQVASQHERRKTLFWHYVDPRRFPRICDELYDSWFKDISDEKDFSGQPTFSFVNIYEYR